MSTLADITGAGSTGVVPGYVLSPPRLREHGMCERAFSRWRLTWADKSTRNAAADVREKTIDLVNGEIRAGYYQLGMRGYDLQAHSARGVRYRFWMSLLVKHPDVTWSVSAALFDNGNQVAITAELNDLWGYGGPVEEDDATPPAWEKIIHHLCAPVERGGRGMKLDEAIDLTLGQLRVILSEQDAKAATPADVNAIARDKQRQMLDRICEMKSIPREKLCNTPADIVAAYVREVIGNKPVNLDVLRGSLAEYAKAK